MIDLQPTYFGVPTILFGRYENTEDGHNKFWEVYPANSETIEKIGANFVVRYGKIGTVGRIMGQNYDGPFMISKIRGKVRKGYVKTAGLAECITWPKYPAQAYDFSHLTKSVWIEKPITLDFDFMKELEKL